MSLNTTCKILASFAFVGMAASGAGALSPSLELKLDQPQELNAAGQKIRVDGEFIKAPDGGTALGIGVDAVVKVPDIAGLGVLS